LIDNSEILDDPIANDSNNRTQLNRIVLLAVGTIACYFIFEIIRNSTPEYLLDWNGVQINTIGLMILGLVILNSILIPVFLNKYDSNLSILKIIGLTGLIIAILEYLFKMIQSIFVLGNGFNLDYISLSKSAALFSFLSMLIANIKIHKLRKKKATIPILILIVLWVSIGVIIKNTSG